MNLPTKFDVVIVGAGPAGSSAAYALAERGFKVLVLERGRVPGSKCVSGCRVFAPLLSKVYPDFAEEAPVQRWVKKERISVVRPKDMLTIEFTTERTTSFTCFLPQLAKWMAKKAEEAGAVVVTEIAVDRLLTEDGKVRGVAAGPDEVEADVVVDAEGVNRLLLEGASFAGKLKPEHVSLAVKETVRLPGGELEDRFGLDSEEGLSWVLLGDVTGGIPGGCFIYTCRDAVSFGVVLALKHAAERLRKRTFDLAEGVRLHPLLKRYFRKGRVVEYSAHLIPEASVRMMPKLYRDGLVVVGDAAGMALSMGYAFRGVDFAAYSGFLAALAIERAHADGGFDEERLAVYEELVKASPVMRQLVKFKGVYDILNDPFTFKEFPNVVAGLAERAFVWEQEAPTLWEAMEHARGDVGWLRLLVKLYRMVKTL